MNDKPDYPFAVVAGTGEVYVPDETGARSLPKKQWRQHRWVATTAYVLSPGQAEAAYEPGNKVLMDMTNLFFYGIGCWDCEEPYPVVSGRPCAVAR